MNLDKTFCASPQCKGECGRQLTEEIKAAAVRDGKPLSMTYFCGEPHPTLEGVKAIAEAVLRKIDEQPATDNDVGSKTKDNNNV